MVIRMGIASERFRQCSNVWKSSIVSMSAKLRLFNSGVVSVLVYGCEIWQMDEGTQRSLRGWCARLVSKITGRSIREECCSPTYPLVQKVRARRARWLGHILRSDERYLVRQVLVAQFGYMLQCGVQYPVGSIMQDAPAHSSMEQLITMAEDRDEWRLLVNSIAAGEGDVDEFESEEDE